MIIALRWILAVIGAGAPLALELGGQRVWALGLVLGEAGGVLTAVWIAFGVQQALQRPGTQAALKLMAHSAGRLVLVAGLLILAIRWPAVNIYSVAIGLTYAQIAFALTRARSEKDTTNDERDPGSR